MEYFYGFAIALFGLVFGSFLNVCIHRLPRGLSVVRPGSACPQCRKPIAFYDNVPVLSWLLLRGRCRNCEAPISARYLAVELLTALLFLGCYAKFGASLATLKYCVFTFLALGLIFTDAEHKLLPDAMTLPGLLLGLGFSLLVPVESVLSGILGGSASPAMLDWRVLSLAESGLGAVAGASFIYGAGMIYKTARGVEGMGFGDVKLMAMVGAFLGIQLTVLTIFGGSLLGSFCGLASMLTVWIKRTRRRMKWQGESSGPARRRAWQSARMVYRYYEMPFGVFLGGMAILALFVGQPVVNWYLGFYR